MLSIVPQTDVADARLLLHTVETWRPHMPTPGWAAAVLVQLLVVLLVTAAVAVAAGVGFLIGSTVVLVAVRRWLPGRR